VSVNRTLPIPLINSHVGFGLKIWEPNKLETRVTSEVLLGIREGEWRVPVEHVRALPPDSFEQKKAKKELAYCMWSGVFHSRCNDGLLIHSGQVGVDVDKLTEEGCTKALQSAVADRFCLAAFRSTRGQGVRLLFRVPPCKDYKVHAIVFEQVAEHVIRAYSLEPDPKGSDVCRASFVSFDRGLWFNGDALILPIDLPSSIHTLSHSVPVTQRTCHTAYLSHSVQMTHSVQTAV
jgi:hypothetical protein